MKTKKPRSGKAVKPAARSIRRVTRSKPKTLHRKPIPAEPKDGKSKTTKKPKLPVRPRTSTAVKVKLVRRRGIRKSRLEASPIPVELESKILRRNPSPAKPKGGESMTTQKSKLPARAKATTAAKVKRVRSRVIRKPRVIAAPIPLASEQPVPWSPGLHQTPDRTASCPGSQRAETSQGARKTRTWGICNGRCGRGRLAVRRA